MGEDSVNLSLSSMSLSFGSYGGTQYITLYNNEKQVKSDGSNISFTKISGSYGTITWDTSSNRIKVYGSSPGECTSGSTTVSVFYKGQSVNFSISYSGRRYSFYEYSWYSSTSAYLPGIACTVATSASIGGTSTTSPKAANCSSNVSWISFTDNVGPAGKSGGYFGINIAQNDTGSNRSGRVTWSLYGCTNTLYITQYKYNTVDRGTIDGRPYIQIGNTKWCTYDVGASSEGQLGNKYQWGSGSTVFTSTSATDYYTGSAPLPASADSATCVMGSHWRTPTQAEWTSLMSEFSYRGGCFYNGQWAIFLVKSSNGKFMLFPSSSGSHTSWCSDTKSYDMLWSTGHDSYFNSGDIYPYTQKLDPYSSVNYGNYVRGVYI